MIGKTEPIATQRALELLSDCRRRVIIRRLREADRTLTLSDLAAVADAEGVEAEEGRASIESDLHHVHVPKLIEAGVVDYDSRSGSVPYHGDETVEKLLAFIDGELE